MNFALFSEHATGVELCLFDAGGTQQTGSATIALVPHSLVLLRSGRERRLEAATGSDDARPRACPAAPDGHTRWPRASCTERRRRPRLGAGRPRCLGEEARDDAAPNATSGHPAGRERESRRPPQR